MLNNNKVLQNLRAAIRLKKKYTWKIMILQENC